MKSWNSSPSNRRLLKRCARAALAAGVLLAAPAAEHPPPSAPWVAPAPSRGQWTITARKKQAAAPAPPSERLGPGAATGPREIREIRSTKTGNIKRDRFVYQDGTSEEHWYVNQVLLEPAPHGGGIMVIETDEASRFMQESGHALQSPGFPGTGWIGASRYRGIEKYGSEPCYHYVLQPPGNDAAEGAEAGDPVAEAWISVKSRLPVAYQIEDVRYEYKFGREPAGVLALPAAHLDAWEKYQRKLAHRKRLQEDLTGR